MNMVLEQARIRSNRTPGLTPLAWAAKGGHEEVVAMLLERDDVDSSAADRLGQTPLFIAAREGHEGVVKLLLGRNNITFSTAAADAKAPLFTAPGVGNESGSEMQLEP